MIKCEFCGSTAQIKLIKTEETQNSIFKTYECGCGCKMVETYTKTNTTFTIPKDKMISAIPKEID